MNKHILHLLILSFIIIFTTTIETQFIALKCSDISFLPSPKKIQCNIRAPVRKVEKPCNIFYRIYNSESEKQLNHFVYLIQHQQQKTFGCKRANIALGKVIQQITNSFEYIVQINVKDPTLRSALTIKQESYSITIQKNQTNIKTDTYVGFVRALETFMQSITCDNYKATNCVMKYLPITIQDQPAFIYRSVMIDTARHYISIERIYETIDALMYNKMNILHWHIVDQDSFPLILNSHPQIADYASFSADQIYTTDQVKDLVKYALVRGVRIIPELDTPGHAASWGKAPQNSKIACLFGDIGYMGPLDVTLSQTYKIVKQVYSQIFQLFPDPLVHLGGDQVVLTCLANQTDFERAHPGQNIQLTYRKLQRKMLKQINPNKRFIYWMNAQIKLQGDDIVHWWGGGLPQTEHQTIISNYGTFYLDMGVGNYFGVPYGSYQTWYDMYNQNIGKMAQQHKYQQKILGAEATLWSQISNQYTHHLKIWIRTSSLAERTWSISNQEAKPDFFRKITAHQRLMNRRGIPTAPATCQQCEFNPQFC